MRSKLLSIYDSYYSNLPASTRVDGVEVDGKANYHTMGLVTPDPNNNYSYYIDNIFEAQLFWFPSDWMPKFEEVLGYPVKAVRGTYMAADRYFRKHKDNHPNASCDTHTFVLAGDGIFRLFKDDSDHPAFMMAGLCDFVFNPSNIYHDYRTQQLPAKLINVQKL